MYNQPEVALERYDLELIQMTKGRGAYMCDTSRGMMALIPFKGSANRASVLYDMLEGLCNNGFDTEKIMLTVDGEALAKDDADISYILKTICRGRECCPDSIDEVKGAMQQLARFHCLSPDKEPPEYMKQGLREEILIFEKHNRELKKVRNYVKDRKKKNEFELKLLGEYQHFYEDAVVAISKMLELDIEDFDAGWRHNAFNYHNVIRVGNSYQLINFEAADFGIQLTDIAGFMRKILEKNDWNISMGELLLNSYEKVRPLKAAERKLLGYMLLYPEKFWKLSNHYYNSHKAWISERYIEKLERIIAQEKYRKAYLQKVF